jgi:hypothetical protein
VFAFRTGRAHAKFGFVGGETIGSAPVPPPVPAGHSRFDMSIATQAREALRRLCELAPERGRAAAHGNLGAPDPEVRRWASLLALGPDSPVDDATVLLPLLRDEEPLLRRRALAALARAATWTPELGCAATDLLADPQADVRALAVRAFAAHAEEVAASRVALQESLANAGEGAVADELRRLLAR